MKKLLFVIPIFIVAILFLGTYYDHSKTLKSQEYVQNMMSNIDISYQVTVRQMQNIRESFLRMKGFFEQDAMGLEETYVTYYELLQTLQEKMSRLDKYILSLENYCGKIGVYQNNQCNSYQENVAFLKEDYQVLIDKYNATIREYNSRMNTALSEI